MKLLLLLFMLNWVNGVPILKGNLDSEDWWKTDVFYQIYPRSFKDSDNDGIGDLNGIRQSLPYLKELGINSTWLSPIFQSPMVDAGYDISDFKDIDPIFGTLKDFDDLIAEAKQIGIRIILDFVPNHSSDKHEWFQKSLKRIDPYTDYFVWNDGKLVNGTRYPPNNWVAPMSSSSAWEWNNERQQYYYHRFAKEMPDLNYRNSKLVEEMEEVLRFWLRKGVAGFRVDAISRLFEDIELRDEPLSNNPACTPVDDCYLLDHRYSADLPETADMVMQWNILLDQFSKETDGIPRVMMTESYSKLEKIMKYYGNSTHDGASFPFNFQMISNLSLNSTASEYKNIIDNWMKEMPTGRTPNWVLGNHDRPRVANRLGKRLVDGLNMFIMTLPGVGVTYSGEEIGMENGYVSWEDTQDPTALSAGRDKYLEVTRDPERTPFHWSDGKNAGFSRANKTWLPVSDKYKTNNVFNQLTCDGESHIKVYQQLIKLRENDVLKYGRLSTQVLGPNVLVISRTLDGLGGLYTVINFGQNMERVYLSEVSDVKKLYVEVNSVGASLEKGVTILTTSEFVLQPFEGYILSSF